MTVLGSCVAACLRDPVNGVCGINHFMLPGKVAELDSANMSARYGMHAMEMLITSMQQMGARRDRLQAKVFGAGSVLDGMTYMNIGELNAAFVLRYLQCESIPVLAQDMLGDSARKVYFFTDSGKVMIRRLKSERIARLVDEETRYRETLVRTGGKSGSVELFD